MEENKIIRNNNNDNNKVRINHHIRAPQVRLVGPAGEQIGIVSSRDALKQAEEHELDLVEIAPQAEPPVCKIMDYGKYLFDQSKRQKKSKQIHIKEVKLRPVTDIGDYKIKLKKAIAFLEEGNKVKMTVRFRGREMAYQQQGADMLKRIEGDLVEFGTVEQYPKLEGRQMVMMVGPIKKEKRGENNAETKDE
ncbi:MAG: translation initiation factor IF-3 [Gammaproteobacteria bacterium]|nr:translation initiation factor IF-3 [Gammaproteobacteria bacterium]